MQNDVTYTPSNVSTTGYVNLGSGASFTLAATSAGDGLAHQISLTTVTDQSGKTITVVGTDKDGLSLTEAVTGPNNTTTYSTGYFKTVTSITPSATLGASTLSAGWRAAFVTPTIPMNRYRSEATVRVVVTGTITYTMRQTLSNIRTRVDDGAFDFSNSTDTDLVAATATQISTFDKPVTGVDFLVSSYSNGAALRLYIVQADY